MPMPERHLLPDDLIPHEAQHAAFDKHRATIKVEVWDRESPINGVPAEHWLGRDDVRDDNSEIYLIHHADDSGTLVFQPHHPNGAPMRPGTAQGHGENHADDIAANRAHTELRSPGQPGAHLVASSVTPGA